MAVFGDPGRNHDARPFPQARATSTRGSRSSRRPACRPAPAGPMGTSRSRSLRCRRPTSIACWPRSTTPRRSWGWRCSKTVAEPQQMP